MAVCGARARRSRAWTRDGLAARRSRRRPPTAGSHLSGDGRISRERANRWGGRRNTIAPRNRRFRGGSLRAITRGAMSVCLLLPGHAIRPAGGGAIDAMRCGRGVTRAVIRVAGSNHGPARACAARCTRRCSERCRRDGIEDCTLSTATAGAALIRRSWCPCTCPRVLSASATKARVTLDATARGRPMGAVRRAPESAGSGGFNHSTP